MALTKVQAEMSNATAPAFSAYATTGSSLTSGVNTKVLFDTEEYDTNNCFASSRFTPTVAGYYNISSCVSYSSLAAISAMFVYKNGSIYKKVMNSAPAAISSASGSCQIYLNGSTDYVEIYVYQGAATQNTYAADQSQTWFQGSLARPA